MKVLIVHDYGTLNGGAEHMSAMLRERLRERGHEVRLFTSTARPLPLPIVADDTCFGTMSKMRHLVEVANPLAVHALRGVLDRFRPDVVHVRMFQTQLSPLILRLLRGVPAILHVVNYNLICPTNTKTLPDGSPCTHRQGMVCHREGCVRLRRLGSVMLRHRLTDLDAFDLIVANSLWVRRRLEQDGVAVDDHVWNGVPTRPQRPPLDGPPTIGFAGRFEAKKGIDVLVHAMVRVRSELPDARLVLVGDGPERKRIEALVAALDLGSCVELTGFRPREEVDRILGSAWVQAVPGRWEEPFGLVAAEAMMRGSAVVVSDSGGVSEVVEEGVTGFRVPAGQVDPLSDALLRVLRDRELAERLGREGRNRALVELTEDRVVDRFESLYRRLVPLGRASGSALVSGG